MLGIAVVALFVIIVAIYGLQLQNDAFLAFVGQPLQNNIASKEIKIGVITTLSGELANYGTAVRNATELAAKEINSNGGINGEKIKLIFEDSTCNSASAVSAVNKLIAVDKVDLLAGPMCSSVLLAIAPLIEKQKTPIISSSATSPDVTNSGDYVFRDVASDNLRAKFFADYIYNMDKIKEIAIIYPNDDATVAYIGFFKKEFAQLGGKTLDEEVYTKGAADMRTQLIKIKNSQAPAVFVPNWPIELANILKESKELDVNVKFYEGFEIMSDPQIKQIAGDLANGITYIQAADANNTEAQQFKVNYQKEYGAGVPFYAAESYDIILLYAKALKNDSNISQVKDELYKIKNFDGASGTITFDANGDCIKPFEIGKIVDGNLTTIKIVN